MKFKVGDRVEKYKWFTDTKYCRFGGEPERFPLGTIGTVVLVNSILNAVEVDFNLIINYSVDVSEIRHIEDNYDGLKINTKSTKKFKSGRFVVTKK